MKAFRFYSLMVLAILMTAGLTACSSDDKEFMGNEPVASYKGDIVKGISVSLSDFESAGAETRTAYSATDGGVKVTWASNDTIGIFPNVGGQVEFPIEAGTASNQATFDGGGWALKSNSTYAAYYPYSAKNSYYTNKTIQVKYTGQKQTANGRTSHLGKYDYQATSGVTTNSSGYLNFQFKHLGALMVFQLTVPKAGTYTSLTLTSSEKVFVTKAELNISGNEPVLKAVSKSKTVTLALGNIALEADNSVLTAYMMLAPADLSQGSLELTIDGDRIFTTTLDGHNLEAGKQYTIEKAFVDDIPSPDEIIAFADDEVKAICVANWDTNKDGELSYDEAAAVTDIGQSFRFSAIKIFNELVSFTGLSSIGEEAFYNCSSLTNITLPEGLNSIDSYAFQYCYNLTSITLPEGLNSIDRAAFYECTNLMCINLPESLNFIHWYAFYGCTSLKSITLPEGLNSICDYTFYGCSSLDRVILPESLSSIEYQAFYNCSGLNSITLPGGLNLIREEAFYGCSSLTSIEIPDDVLYIGYSTFKDCTSLMDVKLPVNLISIHKNSFSGCTSLTSIEIPDGVSTIDESAFAGCTSLTSVKLPTSIATLGHSAFKGCTKLESIEMPEGMTSIGFYAFANCTNLKSVVLPESMKTISGGAFNNSTSLKSIVLPQAVSSIGTSAFKGSKNLEMITVKNTTPPSVDSNAFSDTGITTIYVPAASVNAYKAADGWKDYASQIQAIPE